MTLKRKSLIKIGLTGLLIILLGGYFGVSNKNKLKGLAIDLISRHLGESRVGDVRMMLEENVMIPVNYLRSLPVEPEHLYIRIKDKHYRKLERQ
ncbi:MAG: hypothetical protein HQM13_24060, partial [SAR324 cluster bacterium]|nr:hypothetical protein [SAR324 cluster bacterium]